MNMLIVYQQVRIASGKMTILDLIAANTEYKYTKLQRWPMLSSQTPYQKKVLYSVARYCICHG
jgi:hypothetical protein